MVMVVSQMLGAKMGSIKFTRIDAYVSSQVEIATAAERKRHSRTSGRYGRDRGRRTAADHRSPGEIGILCGQDHGD